MVQICSYWGCSSSSVGAEPLIKEQLVPQNPCCQLAGRAVEGRQGGSVGSRSVVLVQICAALRSRWVLFGPAPLWETGLLWLPLKCEPVVEQHGAVEFCLSMCACMAEITKPPASHCISVMWISNSNHKLRGHTAGEPLLQERGCLVLFIVLCAFLMLPLDSVVADTLQHHQILGGCVLPH